MLIDGKTIRDRIQRELQVRLSGSKVALAILIVGDNPVVESFVKIKKSFAENIGADFFEYRFSETVLEGELVEQLKTLASDTRITGIVVQLPLPTHINTDFVVNAIPPEKDVDILSSRAIELFEKEALRILPPVVGAIKEILNDVKFQVKGKKVLVVGQGRLVGLPVGVWLKQQGADVTVLGEPSEHLEDLVRNAEVVVSGAGVPNLIKPEMVTPGTLLIDAGSSESLGKIVGDINPLCEAVSFAQTPVPGGVGPVTVAVLFRNLVRASEGMEKNLNIDLQG
jgi:methylenetetrahydrofolate dehydrogenase (NADP+)/methenyltetrahydrofolate cyclohydrolase